MVMDTEYHSREPMFRTGFLKKSSSRCNSVACAIAACFIIALSALALSITILYMFSQQHGFGPIPAASNGESSTGSQGRQNSLQSSSFQGNHTLPQQQLQHRMVGAIADAPVQAFAHIVGLNTGARSNDHESNRLLAWRENVTYNVVFKSNSGTLVIKEPGFYYVYSQLYFSDTEIPEASRTPTVDGDPMRFSTRRNNQPILESVLPYKEYSTKFHGGVIYLEKWDQISVGVSDDHIRINTEGERTYFGVFLLSTTSTRTTEDSG